MTSPTKFENYFRVFRDILRSIYHSISLQEVFNIVVTKTAEVLNAKGALLRILNQETRQFDIGAAYGLGDRYVTKGPVSTEKLLHHPSELHKVKIITDIWHAPRVEYPQLAWDEGIRMILDVPMAIGNEMRGMIRIYLAEPRTFSPDELDFMVTVAEQCACIIERVRLAENQQTHITHLSTQMEKMSSLGRIAAGVAHEINNPLSRMFAHFHTGTMTRISPKLDIEQRTGYVCINPKDARALDVSEGGALVLSPRCGDMEAPTKITPSVAPGTLFLPIHFGENPTNVLTNAEAFGPPAKIPEFKVAAVRVEKLTA